MVSTSFNLAGLVIFPVIFYFLHRWPKAKVEVIETSRVGIIRRIAALYVDVFVGIIGILPIICMTSLTIEYLETSQWAWSFERDYYRPSDVLGTAVYLLGFFGGFYYSKWHFVRGKQTLGQHWLKFKLLPVEEKTNFPVRALVAWANLACWPIWPWTIMKRKQDYSWDNASKIKARKVTSI